jgi:hypothetical protein
MAPDGPVHSSPVMSAGQVIVGAVLSRTVTRKLQVELFRLASVAVQATDVVPIAKVLPEGGTQTTAGAGSQRSLTVGAG